MSEDLSKDRRYIAGGLFVTAGVLIGMGIGWAMGYLVQGILAGIGCGFIIFAIIMLVVRD